MSKTLLAFHGDPKVKAKYLRRVRAHEKADEIIHGVYWEDGKGCAIGCTIEGREHKRYETELGLPEWLAHLEDALFEGMENGDAKTFPRRFLASIKPGADLSLVRYRFQHYVLTEVLKPEYYEGYPDVAKAVARVALLNEKAAKGQKVQKRTWESARSAARSAAWSAESAAESAAWSAAWSAARSAAWSAESAAWSAESAESAWSASYKDMAETLLKMLKETK